MHELFDTRMMTVDAEEPEAEVIEQAVAVLRSGGLVAFPTETVYGLGANALDAAAVAGIFAAKGRPANNPLIVHVPDIASARRLVSQWTEAAEQLAATFWPGPLTLVLPRLAVVPDIVTAGGPTVALRVPAHPVAQALLKRAGFPVAAPSANRSEQLSPTTAAHVRHGLEGRIAMILDGGPTRGGLESTVLGFIEGVPTLLRPGLISPAQIEAVLGPIRRSLTAVASPTEALVAPGMMARHYAPRATLELDGGWERVDALRHQGEKVGWVTFANAPDDVPDERVVVTMPDSAAEYAARLYATLHTLDDAGVTRIVVDALPETEEWLAIRDRLRRAATPR